MREEIEKYLFNPALEKLPSYLLVLPLFGLSSRQHKKIYFQK